MEPSRNHLWETFGASALHYHPESSLSTNIFPSFTAVIEKHNDVFVANIQINIQPLCALHTISYISSPPEVLLFPELKSC